MDEINGEDVLPPMGIIFSTSLVELERIQQLEELAVLLRVLQLDVVLLQPVQCQLGLVVDVDLHGLQRKECSSSSQFSICYTNLK